MAQLDDLYSALKNADAAGDTAGAQKLANYIQTVVPTLQARHQAIASQIDNDAISQGARDPTQGMSGVEKFVAGYGKALPDMARGIGQRLGLVSQQDVDEAHKRDAPLMASGAATAGNIAGNIASALPAVAIPGAASIPGAAAIGGVLGGIQPTVTGESALKNTAIGAGLGGASVLGGQLAGAAYRGGKAILEPFTEAGAQRIAGRTIQRFAEDPSRIASVTNKPTITGALPTLAEQTGDVGLARLQDSLRSVDPQINNALATRASSNNASRVNALREMAGQDGARDFAVANRGGTAEQLYGDAFRNNAALSPSQLKAQSDLLKSNQIDKLLQSPAIQEAQKAAQTNAANAGRSINTDGGSIEGLHNMKLAIDDMIKDPATAAQAAKAAGLRAARDKLVGVIETLSPDYKAARVTYADMSKPINQMDIANQLAKKGLSNGSDLSGNPTINRNALLGALKDEPALMRQATGRNLGGSLSDVMEPQQMTMLNALRSEVDRAGAVATAGNGPGSATAQRLASQNILRQTISPNGGGGGIGQKIGQAVVDNTLANTLVGKATNWLYSGIAEPKIQQQLLKAVLSPEDAKAALLAAQQKGIQLPNNLVTRLIGQARRVTGVASAPATRQP